MENLKSFTLLEKGIELTLKSGKIFLFYRSIVALQLVYSSLNDGDRQVSIFVKGTWFTLKSETPAKTEELFESLLIRLDQQEGV